MTKNAADKVQPNDRIKQYGAQSQTWRRQLNDARIEQTTLLRLDARVYSQVI